MVRKKKSLWKIANFFTITSFKVNKNVCTLIQTDLAHKVNGAIFVFKDVLIFINNNLEILCRILCLFVTTRYR